MKKQSYFEYNTGKDITGDAFRISASQVSNFLDNTNSWYREHLLGEGGFEGNTGSNLGTCVHGAIEMYINEGVVDWDIVHNYIDSITDPEVDINLIHEQVEPMVNAALTYVDNYIPPKVETEKFVFHELIPNYGAGGSIDVLVGDTIIDWKTTSQKSPITKFSRNYWFQQLTYAYVLKQQGINVRYIKLVYITRNETGRVSEKTGKALKDYPSQIYEVVEEVTDEALEIVGNTLKLIAESVKTFNEHPELRHLLAQDWRLKINKPKLFK